MEHAEAMAEAVRVSWSLKIEAALDEDGEFEADRSRIGATCSGRTFFFEVPSMPRRRCLVYCKFSLKAKPNASG